MLQLTSRHIPYLARRGRLRAQKRDGRWWPDEASVRESLQERQEWISLETAAEMVGCHPHTVLRHVQAGEIEQRAVDHALPSLSRESVERFGEQRRAELAATQDRRDARALRASGPPEDGEVWLNSVTTALVLGLSTTRVDQLARAERLPYTLRGRRRWFRRSHVEQIAAARALNATLRGAPVCHA